jgi:hypothetical protein
MIFSKRSAACLAAVWLLYSPLSSAQKKGEVVDWQFRMPPVSYKGKKCRQTSTQSEHGRVGLMSATCYDESFSPERQCSAEWNNGTATFSVQTYVKRESPGFSYRAQTNWRDLKKMELPAELFGAVAQQWMETICGSQLPRPSEVTEYVDEPFKVPASDARNCSINRQFTNNHLNTLSIHCQKELDPNLDSDSTTGRSHTSLVCTTQIYGRNSSSVPFELAFKKIRYVTDGKGKETATGLESFEMTVDSENRFKDETAKALKDYCKDVLTPHVLTDGGTGHDPGTGYGAGRAY